MCFLRDRFESDAALASCVGGEASQGTLSLRLHKDIST